RLGVKRQLSGSAELVGLARQSTVVLRRGRGRWWPGERDAPGRRRVSAAATGARLGQPARTGGAGRGGGRQRAGNLPGPAAAERPPSALVGHLRGWTGRCPLVRFRDGHRDAYLPAQYSSAPGGVD